MMRGQGISAGAPAATRPPPRKTNAAEDDPSARAPPHGRKKGAAGGVVRTWMTVDEAGEAEVVEAGKHAIMRRTGLPGRDLRILDPLLSYPSTMLGRERAIVVNLENIKAIITAHEVLLLNSRDPAVAPFVAELQTRLRHRRHHHHHHAATQGKEEAELGNGDSNWTSAHGTTEERSNAESPALSYSGDSCSMEGDDRDRGARKTGSRDSVGPKALPFEFIALEACLEAACSSLESETKTLEQEAHPALDKLTSKISTLNLERVRQIKSRLVAITGRVQKVRDELEQLLDDDDDMAEMYLTEKLMTQCLSVGSSSHRIMTDERISAEFPLDVNDVLHSNGEDELQHVDNHDLFFSGTNVVDGSGHGTHTSTAHSGSKHLNVEELEMLLEAYFVQIDGTVNKLSTLREYVDDTEDYINIMLDDKQNHLLQMGVVLTTATLVVSAFIVVVGVFGMNIKIELFEDTKSGMSEFLWTVCGGATGSVLLYVIAMAWCKHRRLLE